MTTTATLDPPVATLEDSLKVTPERAPIEHVSVLRKCGWKNVVGVVAGTAASVVSSSGRARRRSLGIGVVLWAGFGARVYADLAQRFGAAASKLSPMQRPYERRGTGA